MPEPLTLISQSVSLSLIAAWLTLGARDNILHPSVNEVYTTQVLEMTRMKAEYPDEYALVAHRAITNRRLQKTAFRLIVALEVIAAVFLWAGVVTLLIALAGGSGYELGKGLGLMGALLFTMIWGGFLIVGNHFSYWFCHEGAQNTHFQMTLWGLGNMIFLTAA